MKPQTTLRILLVLSMISAVANFLTYLVMALFLPAISNIYATYPDLLPAEFYTLWEQMSAVPQAYYGGMAFLYVLSFAGCILMWKLHRFGFHCYAIAQLLMLVLPLLFLGKGFLGIGDVMFTALFLFFYWLLLRQLGAFTPAESLPPTEEPSNEENND